MVILCICIQVYAVWAVDLFVSNRISQMQSSAIHHTFFMSALDVVQITSVCDMYITFGIFKLEICKEKNIFLERCTYFKIYFVVAWPPLFSHDNMQSIMMLSNHPTASNYSEHATITIFQNVYTLIECSQNMWEHFVFKFGVKAPHPQGCDEFGT